MSDVDKLAKVQSRVQKLIAQAEGTDNQEEAATFYAAAEDLMLRYAIDADQLKGKDAPKDEIIILTFQHPHAAIYWSVDRPAASLIAQAVGLCGLAADNTNRVIYLYGTKQDAEYTKTMILSVWKQQRRHMRLWKKVNPELKVLSGAPLRNVEKGFYLGFAKGAGEKITESRESVTSETGGELVLANRMNEVKDFMADKVGRGRATGPRSMSGRGFNEGRQRGRDANLGHELGRAKRTVVR